MLKVLSITFLITIFIPGSTYAAYFGGLSENLRGQMLTISADVGYKTRDVKSGSSREELSSRSFAIKTTYGLSDKLDIFASIGFADLQDIGSYTGALGTLLGGGVKYLLIGAENGNKISIEGAFETFESNDSGSSANYSEYHVAAVISKNSGNFTPFGGIKFSDADVDFAGAGTYGAEKHFGLFGGVDYFVNPNVYFSGEVHIFDENSLYLGVGYNF